MKLGLIAGALAGLLLIASDADAESTSSYGSTYYGGSTYGGYGTGEPKSEPKKATVKTVVVEDEADTAGSGAQRKECDAKWKAHKAKSGEHGWKPYFTFMAKCM